jgi:hypothetical protein
MDRSESKRLVTAWGVVVALTVIYLIIDRSADGDGVLRANTVASVAAIALALVKLRIILREFMDVRHAPRVLRRLTDALVLVMGACLLGTYLVGRSIA